LAEFDRFLSGAEVEILPNRKLDPLYETFEHHVNATAEHYGLDYLEKRGLILDRPRYNYQESLWSGYSCILKSKIEQHYFDVIVLVVAEEDHIFEVPIQKILHPAYWAQIVCPKNFGTIDEGQSLCGTVYLKKIKLFPNISEEYENLTGIRFFDLDLPNLKDYFVMKIGLTRLQDPKVTNKDIVEDVMKEKWIGVNLSTIFIRELVSIIRKDLR
jgi:hypothetical protein